ncbi:hypothetical protein PRIPAC_95489 [Pristionchus pacificus]|uniref:Uncharacterized protein n=1 Tax=Pristionchus pacificus TaxID=54126 RepID=A0A2A6BJQ1_PRIPA|nr:hypothetical protein PRIPAC_95489 [Pristionchus pacificus]|eukprot:PDM66021.1 hypothetical protein PRIPAC_44115 [Pristionchus pacificus]
MNVRQLHRNLNPIAGSSTLFECTSTPSESQPYCSLLNDVRMYVNSLGILTQLQAPQRCSNVRQLHRNLNPMAGSSTLFECTSTPSESQPNCRLLNAVRMYVNSIGISALLQPSQRCSNVRQLHRNLNPIAAFSTMFECTSTPSESQPNYRLLNAVRMYVNSIGISTQLQAPQRCSNVRQLHRNLNPIAASSTMFECTSTPSESQPYGRLLNAVRMYVNSIGISTLWQAPQRCSNVRQLHRNLNPIAGSSTLFECTSTPSESDP